MMHYPVLAFDTCAEIGTVALVDADFDTATVALAGQRTLGGRAASAELMPAIAALLRDAQVAIASVRALVVVHGPGSFTGIRVGLSTTKGLAHAAGTPIVAVSRLQVLEGLSHAKSDVLSVLDAGRNEYYARHRGREWLASFDEVAAEARAGLHLIVAEERTAARFAEWKPELAASLDAVAAARTALPRLRAGDYDDLAALDANYLRKSDAELFARPAS